MLLWRGGGLDVSTYFLILTRKTKALVLPSASYILVPSSWYIKPNLEVQIDVNLKCDHQIKSIESNVEKAHFWNGDPQLHYTMTTVNVFWASCPFKTAQHLLTSTRKCNHITLVKSHYCLTIRLKFVKFWASLRFWAYLPAHSPRSASKIRSNPRGDGNFRALGPKPWNKLPLHIREASSLAAFNYSLKTIWFFGFCYLLMLIFMVLSFIACAIEYTFVLRCAALCYNEEFWRDLWMKWL